MLKLHVLASGSKGNAAIIEDAVSGDGILVDCGICKRDFFSRCDEASFDAARIRAILITHEHSDHTKGLGVVYRGLKKLDALPPVVALSAVYCASSDLQQLEKRDGAPVATMEVGKMFSLGNVNVLPFVTSHDAAGSCGFRFECEDDAVGYMTDTGVVTDEAFAALKGVRILALESNHDEKMLKDGDYPWHLKQRVSSDKGHLSNSQAAQALEVLLGDRLQCAVAMHVSQNNNTYRLPVESLQSVVENAGASVRVVTSWQERLLSVE